MSISQRSKIELCCVVGWLKRRGFDYYGEGSLHMDSGLFCSSLVAEYERQLSSTAIDSYYCPCMSSHYDTFPKEAASLMIALDRKISEIRKTWELESDAFALQVLCNSQGLALRVSLPIFYNCFRELLKTQKEYTQFGFTSLGGVVDLFNRAEPVEPGTGDFLESFDPFKNLKKNKDAEERIRAIFLPIQKKWNELKSPNIERSRVEGLSPS